MCGWIMTSVCVLIRVINSFHEVEYCALFVVIITVYSCSICSTLSGVSTIDYEHYDYLMHYIWRDGLLLSG